MCAAFTLGDLIDVLNCAQLRAPHKLGYGSYRCEDVGFGVAGLPWRRGKAVICMGL